jgi:hypothetical protein
MKKFLCTILALAFSAGLAQGATKIALHATAEEKTIWQAHRTESPYSTYWNDILAEADAWVATPDARWP